VKLGFGGFGTKSMIGLDIGSSTVKAVEITMKGRGHEFELTNMGVAKLASEAIVQGAFLNSGAISDAIREAIDNAKIKTKHAAAAVCGHSVIVKKVSLPTMTRAELDEQIRWEAEQYIPFDINEVNLDFQILQGAEMEGQMEVLLVAAKKDLIDDYLQVINEVGLTPVAIDVAAFAVENAFEANYDLAPNEVIALVNIGAQVVNINILANGAPAFTRDITTAGNQYTEEIQKALSVNFDEAERIKLGGRRSDESHTARTKRFQDFDLGQGWADGVTIEYRKALFPPSELERGTSRLADAYKHLFISTLERLPHVPSIDFHARLSVGVDTH